MCMLCFKCLRAVFGRSQSKFAFACSMRFAVMLLILFPALYFNFVLLEYRDNDRERQIMNVLYRRETATVAELAIELPNSPTESAIRTHLKILEDKKLVKRRKGQRGYAYRAAQAKTRAGSKALGNVLDVFFGGSMADALTAHFASDKKGIDAETAERIKRLIDEATQDEH